MLNCCQIYKSDSKLFIWAQNVTDYWGLGNIFRPLEDPVSRVHGASGGSGHRW